MRVECSARRFAALAACLLFIVAPWSTASAKYKLHTLYAFCAEASCADGSASAGRLLADATGNLYGSTFYGGAYGSGTAFEMIRGAGNKWKHKILYSFCPVAGCADGQYPSAGLIQDKDGNLYGTTYRGGDQTFGVAFELTPNAKRTKWKLTVLHHFCSEGASACTDGSYLVADLTYAGEASGASYDGTSPLYGTTYAGGLKNAGTVFTLKPGARKWTETVLYNFCTFDPCTDGGNPVTGVLVGSSGNLFGTAINGGGNATGGTVFELSPNAHLTKWTLTTLHSFCTLPSCTDGNDPQGELLMDGTGKLLGTSFAGGTASLGTVFALTPNGTSSNEAVLYNFCTLTNCTDGSYPDAGLTMDASSNMFGTNKFGGTTNNGAVFKLKGAEQVVYSFCALTNCVDGVRPLGGVIVDNLGDLFGTTSQGGPSAQGGGTIYELTP